MMIDNRNVGRINSAAPARQMQFGGMSLDLSVCKAKTAVCCPRRSHCVYFPAAQSAIQGVCDKRKSSVPSVVTMHGSTLRRAPVVVYTTPGGDSYEVSGNTRFGSFR